MTASDSRWNASALVSARSGAVGGGANMPVAKWKRERRGRRLSKLPSGGHELGGPGRWRFLAAVGGAL
jgi:hypothetical protein